MPVAANPWRILGTVTIFGVTFTLKGSKHMVQSTGFAYAADVNPSALIPFDLVPWHSDYLRGAPAPLGLTRTVQPRRRAAWELWHLEALPDVITVYDDPLVEALMEAKGTYVRNRGMTGWSDGSGLTVVAQPGVDVGAEHRDVFDLVDAPPSVEISDALWYQLARR